jgi:hypothetical protein
MIQKPLLWVEVGKSAFISHANADELSLWVIRARIDL